MTLKQLQYIVMIAETGNITEAARGVQIAAFSTARRRSKWWYKVKFLQFSPGNKDSDPQGRKILIFQGELRSGFPQGNSDPDSFLASLSSQQQITNFPLPGKIYHYHYYKK